MGRLIEFIIVAVSAFVIAFILLHYGLLSFFGNYEFLAVIILICIPTIIIGNKIGNSKSRKNIDSSK